MSSIILITPTPPDISAFGVRSLSAFLRRAGHRTRLVFLPGSAGLLKERGEFVYCYEARVIDQLIELCKGFDFIGISFMTYYLDRAIQITQTVKKNLNIPVIWGGIHATCKPEEALLHADMVCVGEGETALTALLNGEKDIPGIWRKTEFSVIRTGTGALIKYLDSLPFFDFSNEDHFIFKPENMSIVPLTYNQFERALPLLPYYGGKLLRGFRIMTDRGCPHQCHYCNVPFIKRMYENGEISYFRNRGVTHVVEELESILLRFPFIKAIQFFDDTFFARSIRWLTEFAASYRDRIGLPFYCQASPTTLSQAKLDILIEAGMVYVEMGIQTGSQRVRSFYNRKETSQQIIDGARMIHAALPRLLPPDYHVIIDSPWENSEDLFETIMLLQQIPKPFGLAISSLVLFPETELYRRALADGLIRDELKEIVRRPFYIAPKKSYMHFLLYLLTFQNIPKWMFKMLLKDCIIRFCERTDISIFYKTAYIFGESIRLADKGLKAITSGDLDRIFSYFKRKWIKDPVVAGRKA